MLSLMVGICIYSSCTGDDYINAIPGNSSAVISADFKSLSEQSNNTGEKSIASLFKLEDLSDCGIDFTGRVFIFETTDGNFGCCAKINDDDKTTAWLTELAKKGMCKMPEEKRNMTYTLLHDSWAIGYNDKAFLIVGPILPAQQPDALRDIARWLKQKDDNGIKETPLYDRLTAMDSPIAMVARLDALPDKLAAPFSLGTPKDADASQIMIAASMTTSENGTLSIEGETFSPDGQIDKEIKDGTSKLRKIGGHYTKNIPSNMLCSILTNVEGKDFVSMLHNSNSLGMMLAGINTAIDMDNILRDADGDIFIGINSYSDKDIRLTMAAQLKKTDFLKDVDYWKKSCPAGSSIETTGPNSFRFKSADANFWFGATATNEFYGSTSKDAALSILKPTAHPLSTEITKRMQGKRFCMVLNIEEMLKQNKEMETVTKFTEPIFGKVRNIIYSIK